MTPVVAVAMGHECNPLAQPNRVSPHRNRRDLARRLDPVAS